MPTNDRMIRSVPDDIHPIDAFTLRSGSIKTDGFMPVDVEVVRCSYCSALVIQDSEDADWNQHVQSHRDVAFSLKTLADHKADAV